MVYDGSATMAGGSAGVFLARVPNAGLQWLAGVTGLTLKGDIDRGYLNGSGLTSSSGSTTANGYGLTGRIGWTFERVLAKTEVTPFVSYTYSTVHFNGYTEATGPLPARFNGFTDTAQTSRLGATRVTPSHATHGCGARWPGRIVSTAAKAPPLPAR
jgi:uncharacterized protein with beta-barrel porin domain